MSSNISTADKPPLINAHIFFDGQNLFRSAQEAFRVPFPDFDPKKLAQVACAKMGWHCKKICFYTGVPPEAKDPGWHYFWKQKRLSMERDGVHVTTTVLRYRQEEFRMSGGGSLVKEVAREKGIDVRIALDVVSAAVEADCQAIIIFSQDQDLAEAVKDVKKIAKKRNTYIHLASAFPMSASTRNRNGIMGTSEFYVDWQVYENCKDTRQYPKP